MVSLASHFFPLRSSMMAWDSCPKPPVINRAVLQKTGSRERGMCVCVHFNG